MTSTTFFIIFIPILSIILLAVNLLLAPHNPYQEKDTVFECGFHSFLGQNRTEFSVSFFIFGLLFLLFDLEILLVYPYSVSSYTNDIYGLVVMILFFILLTLGFIFELGKNALTIESKQTSMSFSKNIPNVDVFYSSFLSSLFTFLKKIVLLMIIISTSLYLFIIWMATIDFINLWDIIPCSNLADCKIDWGHCFKCIKGIHFTFAQMDLIGYFIALYNADGIFFIIWVVYWIFSTYGICKVIGYIRILLKIRRLKRMNSFSTIK